MVFVALAIGEAKTCQTAGGDLRSIAAVAAMPESGWSGIRKYPLGHVVGNPRGDPYSAHRDGGSSTPLSVNIGRYLRRNYATCGMHMRRCWDGESCTSTEGKAEQSMPQRLAIGSFRRQNRFCNTSILLAQ
jgi:hypothetical protein